MEGLRTEKASAYLKKASESLQRLEQTDENMDITLCFLQHISSFGDTNLYYITKKFCVQEGLELTISVHFLLLAALLGLFST